jgi:hypothetical protein
MLKKMKISKTIPLSFRYSSRITNVITNVIMLSQNVIMLSCFMLSFYHVFMLLHIHRLLIKCMLSYFLRHLSTSIQRDNIMVKQHICSKCGKEYANRHNLSRHRKVCLVFTNQSSNPQYKPVSDCSSNVFQAPVKPPNPKISALVDAIVNDDSSAPLMKEIPNEKDLSDFDTEESSEDDVPDLISMDTMDESVDKSMDNSSKDHSDEDIPDQKSPTIRAPHLSNKEKKLFNKFSLIFRETKQNKGKLFVLLNDLIDSASIDNDDYDKIYNAIKNL